MMKEVMTGALLVALASLAPGQVDKPAPALALKDVAGQMLRLSDYKGKVVLINFWATWCAPCRAEMPDLIKWQREYRRRGLQVIGIAYPPGELAEVRKFTKMMKVNYPIALGKEETKTLFDQGETLPMTVVIDRQGVVREIIQGILFPEEFEQKIMPLF